MRILPLGAILNAATATSTDDAPGVWLEAWFSRSWGSPWSQLDSTQRAQVQQAWGPQTIRVLQNLSQETSPEIFWSDFYSLGQTAEASQHYGLSRSIYEAIVAEQPGSTWAGQAQNRLNLMEGGGRLGDRLEWAASRLADQVTDVGVLAGMGVGSYGYFLSRSAALRLLGAETLGARALANCLGFATEVPGMVLTTRAVHHWVPPAGGVGATTLAQDFRHLGLSLLALRGAGGLTRSILGPMTGAPLATRALPQVAMFNGILAMRGLEHYLDWNRAQSPEAFMVDAMSLYIQFNAMARLVPHPPATALPASRPRIRPDGEWSPSLSLAWAHGMAGPARGPGALDSTVLMSQGASPSSYPPPAMEPARGGGPRRGGSGVQVRGGTLRYTPIVESFSQLETEVHEILNQGNFHLGEWKAPSQSVLSRTRETLLWLDDVGRSHLQRRASLPYLPEIVGEIEFTHRLLSEFNPETGRVELDPQQLALLDSYLSHQYAVPNKMINFINGDASMAEVHSSARLSRLALQDFIEGHTLPPGPVFAGELNGELVAQANRYGGNIFRAYSISARRPWYGPTLESAQGFEDYLRQTGRRMGNAAKPNLFVEGTQVLENELQQMLQVLEYFGRSKGRLPQGPRLDTFLTHLFKAPNAYAQFLETGRMSYLRTSQFHLSQAKASLAGEGD